MDYQGTLPNVTGSTQNVTIDSTPPPIPSEFHSQLPVMPPPPFFQGFGGAPNQMPFMFPHSFMSHVHGLGFPPPVQGSPPTTIDLTEASLKRGPQDGLTDQPTSAKKRRGPKKKIDVVELDDAKEEVELLKNAGPWKDHWVIQLITIRGEMQNTFSAPPKQGVDNWSQLHTKIVSMCPDFTKDSEACRKKWAAIYNDYKEDKAMNAKSGSQRSEKCRWYQLVDEFMYDRANVVSHAHASVVNPDGPKCGATSYPNTSEIRSGENTSKSPEPKRKEEIFLERCIGEIKDSSNNLMQGMKSSGDMRMALLLSMQQTMQKLVEKL